MKSIIIKKNFLIPMVQGQGNYTPPFSQDTPGLCLLSRHLSIAPPFTHRCPGWDDKAYGYFIQICLHFLLTYEKWFYNDLRVQGFKGFNATQVAVLWGGEAQACGQGGPVVLGRKELQVLIPDLRTILVFMGSVEMEMGGRMLLPSFSPNWPAPCKSQESALLIADQNQQYGIQQRKGF